MTKMFRHAKSFGMVAMALLLSGALLLGSVVPAKAAEERVVKIGAIAYLTGPIASVGTPCYHGMIDYVRSVNKRGGINGIKVESTWVDLGSAPYARVLSAHKRFVEAGIVMYQMHSSAVELVATLAEKDKMPMVLLSSLGEIWEAIVEPMWIFGIGPGYSAEFATFMKWVVDNWTEERPPRIAYMGYEAAAGRLQLEAFKYKAVQELNMDYVGEESVGYLGIVDTSVEWLRVAAKKPDWVYVAHYGSSMAVLVKDAARLGIAEKGIKLCAHTSCLDEGVIAMTGKDSEGWMVPIWTPTARPMDLQRFPGMRDVCEAAKKYRGVQPEGIRLFYVCGWQHGQLVLEGIRRAIEKFGFEKLTGSTVREGIVSIKDWDSGLQPVATVTDYSPTTCRCVRFAEVREGKIWPITDWIEAPFIVGGKETRQLKEKIME